MAEHVIEHEQVSSTITLESLEVWTRQVLDWEKDPTNDSILNPFEVTVEGPTQTAVRRQLAEEEAKDIAEKRDFALDDTVSASVHIANGLDLEAEQCAVRAEAKKLWQHAQDRQKTRLQLHMNALKRKIDSFVKYQILYCPGAELLRSKYVRLSDIRAETKPYDFPLWLPSQIKGQVPVSPQLQRIEWKLRYAQAHESLDQLWSNLQVRAYLYQFKDRFVRGQAANTRARNTISTIDAKIEAATQEYRAAYEALVALGAILFKSSWTSELLPLKDEDIRDLSEGKAGQSAGKRTISWIWKTIPTDGGTAFMHDRLRVEWAESRARAHRFTEEVQLLSEEMSRVLQFFEFKADEWEKKGKTQHTSPVRAEGILAYADHQATMYRNLRKYCAELWSGVPAHIARMQEIIQDPRRALPGEFDSSTAGKEKMKKKDIEPQNS
ncbi:hypothetical protein NLJ89_g8690 [Agrocybe chaxingu]|uniref:Uncharacterized protein n=1 Tax=Agrocybe chaxingu TaxID=84603 RepID=A0A9W8MU94_9AGAR|nr:hypothetical protein NLJ89_g8690 [Agrocybe chaxingu]